MNDLLSKLLRPLLQERLHLRVTQLRDLALLRQPPQLVRLGGNVRLRLRVQGIA